MYRFSVMGPGFRCRAPRALRSAQDVCVCVYVHMYIYIYLLIYFNIEIYDCTRRFTSFWGDSFRRISA